MVDSGLYKRLSFYRLTCRSESYKSAQNKKGLFEMQGFLLDKKHLSFELGINNRELNDVHPTCMHRSIKK